MTGRLAVKMEATAAYLSPRAYCAAPDAAQTVETPDDALVAQALAGTPGALDVLTERYRGRIYAFALTMLQHPDNAEDVAQETLLRAFAALPQYRNQGQFRAWLFRIAGNVCRDRHRHGSRRDVPLDAVPLVLPGGDPQEGVTLRTVVFQAVARLAPIYRGPVLLHYMEGLSVAETAVALGRSQTAVRVQLWRARSRLAQELAPWWQEEQR